ncbi:MAG: hypothetical protein ACJ0RM_03645 [Alphaproteobacteria bacterium]
MFLDFYYPYLLIFIISFILDVFILFKSQHISKFLGILDHPTKRKNHQVPTPLIFSVIFLKNLFVFVYISSFSNFSILLSIVIFLFIMFGISDDKKNISYLANLFITSLLILLTLEMFPNLIIDKVKFYYIKTFTIDHIGIYLTLLCLSFILIISNWFDGHNTFSSFFILSLLLFFILKLDFKSETYPLILLVTLSLIIFLLFNYFGKVFLGSGGIYPISFLCGFLFLVLNSLNNILFEEILSLCLIPIIDFFSVLVKRLRNNQSIFLPDNLNHYHHVMKDFSYNLKIIIILTHSILGFLGAYYIYFNIYFIIINLFLYIFVHIITFKY